MKHRILLDTQVFILAIQQEGHLPSKVRKALLERENSLFLSLVSLWEIQIKESLGKLKLPAPLREVVQAAIREMGLEFLPVQAEHIYKLAALPLHHRDPFDRLLIAQALCERMTLAGSDPAFDQYPIQRLWS